MNHTSKQIAVIGAGPAGLVAAKTFLESGFEVTLYETGTQVGGTWVYDNDNGRAFIYRSLHLNTAKRYTRFSDFDFAPGVADFPDHRDMHRYLRAYADHFGITSKIRFRSEVTSIQPCADAGGNPAAWRVQTAAGESAEYQAVAVCTSPFHRPRHPEQLRTAFKGQYVHAADYREPSPFVGKRVCVIGGGNSAVDIASDVCATAARTVMVSRSAVFIIPQALFGRSFGELVVSYLQRWWVPGWLRRRLVKAAVRAIHGDVARLGFKAPTHRVHPTISATIVADIQFGRVAVKQGIAGIAGRAIRFSDRTEEEFDVIIAATGYDMRFHFVPETVVRAHDNRIDLYKRVVVPGWPGLYFVGIINLDTPINYACERQSRWIASIERGEASLPAREAMIEDIRAKHAWVEKNYGSALRHTVQEESTRYYAELEFELLRARHPRWLARWLAFLRSGPDARR